MNDDLLVRPGGIARGAKVYTVVVSRGMQKVEQDQQLTTIAEALDDIAKQAGSYRREQAILQAASDLWDVLAER